MRSPGSRWPTSGTAGRRWSTRSPTRPLACRTPSATSSRPRPPSPSPSRIARLTPGDLDHVHLHVGRVGGRRGRAEDGAPLPRAPRRARPLRVRLALDELPRGDARRRSPSAARSCGGRSTSRCCSRRRTFGRPIATAAHGPRPIRTAAPLPRPRSRPRSWRRDLAVSPPCIGEPIIASVGGAIRPQDDYWPLVREICDRHGVLLILDEVLTGLRTDRAPFRGRPLGRRARPARDGQGRQRRVCAARRRRGAPARA